MDLAEVFQRLPSQPLFNWLALLIGVAGVLASVYLYVRGKRTKEPFWAIRSHLLVEGYSTRFGGLDVTFGGKSIENLSVARVLIWNNGNQTIDRTDLQTADRIHIALASPAKLLDVRVLATNSPSEFSCIASSDTTATIDFEYLDRGQGAVVQLIHTGLSSKDVTVRGSAKGSRPPKQRRVTVYRWLPLPTSAAFDANLSPVRRRKTVALLNGAIALTALLLVVAEIVVRRERPDSGVDFLLNSLMALYAFAFAWRALRIWRGSVPKGLEIYEEDMVGR